MLKLPTPAVTAFLCLLTSSVSAEGIATPYQEAALRDPPSVSQGSIPQCLDVQPPNGGQLGNSAFRNVSDDELLARLIYAETLAARCPSENSAMAPKIAEVIFSRLRDFKEANRDKPVRRVVFGRDMFGSSLSGSRRAKWREFVCPSENGFESGLYGQSVKLVESLRKNPPRTDITHYFLHLYTNQYNDHPWGLKAKLRGEVKRKDGQRCLGVYHESKSYLNSRMVE